MAPRRALLLNPRQSAAARQTSSKCLDETSRLMARAAASPPLGLLTVAGLLPADWSLHLADQNARELTEDDWNAGDLVLISGYADQSEAQAELIAEARRRGKTTVVGGGWASAAPAAVQAAGADFVVVDEAELGLPLLLEQIESGAPGGIVRPSGNADVTLSPAPRFDLLDMSRYVMATVQFSRGCPFRCEFCDVIEKGIGGKTMRVKEIAQFLGELDALYASGWRGQVFIADDNFIGDRKPVRRLLPELAAWMRERDFPFTLMTEATINLALDEPLVEAMVAAGITRLFVGIESVDEPAIRSARKRQNLALPADEACRRLARAGIEVHAAVVLGFDGETAGAGARLLRFLDEAPVATVDFNFLYALPDAALTRRLADEGRLLSGRQPALPGVNFVPSRPRQEILDDALEFYAGAYDPGTLMERCWRQHRELATARLRRQSRPTADELRSFGHVLWRHGVRRSRRWSFWHHLADLASRRPAVIWSFLRALAHAETHIAIDRRLRPAWQTAFAEQASTGQGAG
ncbi:B12-binding domain-containing radical SAM protein [Tistlia consotensis]|nr:B12-binding domain-containing radical SAM protein [Tistlia consotensis]